MDVVSLLGPFTAFSRVEPSGSDIPPNEPPNRQSAQRSGLKPLAIASAIRSPAFPSVMPGLGVSPYCPSLVSWCRLAGFDRHVPGKARRSTPTFRARRSARALASGHDSQVAIRWPSVPQFRRTKTRNSPSSPRNTATWVAPPLHVITPVRPAVAQWIHRLSPPTSYGRSGLIGYPRPHRLRRLGETPRVSPASSSTSPVGS